MDVIDSSTTHNTSDSQYIIGEYTLIPVSLECKTIFEKYFNQCQISLSDYSFTNNFIWLDELSGFYQIIDNCLCVFNLTDEQLSMILPPIGNPEDQLLSLYTCFDIMNQYNKNTNHSIVEYVYKDFLHLLIEPHPWNIVEGRPDYIHSIKEMITLKGNKFKNKRNEINQFCKSYLNFTLKSLTTDQHEDILKLTDVWITNKPARSTSMSQERKAIVRSLKNFEILSLKGLCLYVDNRLEGFTIGEHINTNTANILFEKTNPKIPGCAQFLFREFCKQFSDCEYVNVGDDLGLENLRKVKESYRPIMYGEKVTIQYDETKFKSC